MVEKVLSQMSGGIVVYINYLQKTSESTSWLK